MSAPAVTDPLTLLAELVREVGELRARVQELEQGETSPRSPWLSITEAADYLRTSERTIHRLVNRNRVRSTTIGRRRLLHRHDLDALLGGGDA